MKKLISKTYYFALLVVSVFIFKSAKADCKTGDTMTDAWDCRTFSYVKEVYGIYSAARIKWDLIEDRQYISIAISNFNILPVTYSISRISLLSGGVIFPGMTINKSDSIFGTPPLVYNYSISTGSSAAFISFVATW
ncbi:hypothetical protein ACR78B_19580 [Sphingobacterium spiritivorum]|uniref:hypothetical protein n=1 Tax=Sphingobacterium spiritivorum TaxID=258 RepID=UPI003DA68505